MSVLRGGRRKRRREEGIKGCRWSLFPSSDFVLNHRLRDSVKHFLLSVPSSSSFSSSSSQVIVKMSQREVREDTTCLSRWSCGQRKQVWSGEWVKSLTIFSRQDSFLNVWFLVLNELASSSSLVTPLGDFFHYQKYLHLTSSGWPDNKTLIYWRDNRCWFSIILFFNWSSKLHLMVFVEETNQVLVLMKNQMPVTTFYLDFRKRGSKRLSILSSLFVQWEWFITRQWCLCYLFWFHLQQTRSTCVYICRKRGRGWSRGRSRGKERRRWWW